MAISLKIKSSASCCLLCFCLPSSSSGPGASFVSPDKIRCTKQEITGRAGKLKDGFFLESTSISAFVQFSPSRNVCTVVQGNGCKQNASKHASCTRRKSETACRMAGQHKLRPSADQLMVGGPLKNSLVALPCFPSPS
jgi:hypothetical protein